MHLSLVTESIFFVIRGTNLGFCWVFLMGFRNISRTFVLVK